MHCKDLHSFYGTPKGRAVRRIIRRAIVEAWPQPSSQDVIVSCGYGIPYLRPFLEKTRSCFSLMPEFQGAIPWPAVAKGHHCNERDTLSNTALIDPYSWPVSDSSISHLLVIHVLEFLQDTQGFLHEVWRVLKPSGTMLLVLPNRHGPWSRAEDTPFGKGTPYSYPSMYQLLEDSGFTVVDVKGVLHFWPFSFIRHAKMSLAFDGLNKKVFSRWPGVWLFKIRKDAVQPMLPDKKHKKLVYRPTLGRQPGLVGVRNPN